MKRYNLGSAVFLFIFGIAVCFETRKLEIGKIFNPGPGFFPLWLGVGLTLVSGILIIKFAFEKTKKIPDRNCLWAGKAWGKNLFVILALFIYVFFLETLGYIIATILLMLFLFGAIGSQKWYVVVAGSIIATFFTFVLFKIWLQVQLPSGILGM